MRQTTWWRKNHPESRKLYNKRFETVDFSNSKLLGAETESFIGEWHVPSAQDELLGRISPSFEDITFSFHIRLESYQRTLIVVSTYDDFEMEVEYVVHLEAEQKHFGPTDFWVKHGETTRTKEFSHVFSETLLFPSRNIQNQKLRPSTFPHTWQEGIVVEFEDFVDSSTFFLLGNGRSLSEEPWLRTSLERWDERWGLIFAYWLAAVW